MGHVFVDAFDRCLICRNPSKESECADYMSTLQIIMQAAHFISRSKGWWEQDRNDGEMIALMHSELSEALEAIRKPGPSEHIPDFTALEEEMADIIIRVADFCYARNIRIEEALAAKMRFNHQRPHKHGGKKF